MMNPFRPCNDHPSSAPTLVPATKRAGTANDAIVLDPEERSLAGVRRSVKLVLLSTDDRFCILVRSYLQHLGFCVFTCTSSDRAERQFLHRGDIDLWLVDAEALGPEAIYIAAKVHDLHAEVPIVLISGTRQEDSSFQRFLGWNSVNIRKPVQLPDLLATIHRALATVPETGMRMHHGDFEYFETEWIDKLRLNHLMN